MANSRLKGKKKLQVWLTEDERNKLKLIAESHGLETVTALLQAVADGTIMHASQASTSSKSAGMDKKKN